MTGVKARLLSDASRKGSASTAAISASSGSKNSEGFFEVNEAFFKTIAISKSKNSWEYTKGFKIMKDGKKPIIIEEPENYIEETSYETIYNLFKKELKFNNVKFTKAQEQSENYKLIKEGIDKFGKIFTVKSYLNEKLKSVKDKSKTVDRLQEDVYNKFKVNREYTRSEVKQKLQFIYNRHRVERKAQFRDLESFGIQFEEKYVDRKRGLIITRKSQK